MYVCVWFCVVFLTLNKKIELRRVVQLLHFAGSLVGLDVVMRSKQFREHSFLPFMLTNV